MNDHLPFEERCHLSIPQRTHRLTPPWRVRIDDTQTPTRMLFDSEDPTAALINVVVTTDVQSQAVDITFFVPESGIVVLKERLCDGSGM